MNLFVLGMDAKLYHGTAGDAGDALTAMTEADNVKDLNLPMEAGEANVTTRANSGWRATAATLKSGSMDFEMLWKPGDTFFDAIKTAYLTNGQIRLAALTGPRDEGGGEGTNSEGPLADWSVTNFTRNEPLEEGITVSVTVKIASFIEWIEDGAESP